MMFSSACVHTAELLSWRGRPSSQFSRKLLHPNEANFMRSYLYTTSPDHFLFFFFQSFKFLRLFFRLSLIVIDEFQLKFMINMLFMGEYRVLLFLAVTFGGTLQSFPNFVAI